MAAKNEQTQWCPFGRISIQRWENGRFKEGVPGAYNLVCRVDMVRGETGERLTPASPCMKDVCAFYRKGGMWREPGCKLSRQSNIGPWVLASLIAVETIAIAAAYLLPRLLP